MLGWWWWVNQSTAASSPPTPPTPVRQGRRQFAFQPCSRCCGCNYFTDSMGTGELSPSWEAITGDWERVSGSITTQVLPLETADILCKRIGSVPYRLQMRVGSSVTVDPLDATSVDTDMVFGFVFGCNSSYEDGYMITAVHEDRWWYLYVLKRVGTSGSSIWIPMDHLFPAQFWMRGDGGGSLSCDVCAYEDSTTVTIRVGSGLAQGQPEIRFTMPDPLVNHYSGVYGGTLAAAPGPGTLSIYNWKIDEVDPEECPDCDQPCECSDELPSSVQVEISGVTGDHADEWNGIYLCEAPERTLGHVLEFTGNRSLIASGEGWNCQAYGYRYPCRLVYDSPTATRLDGPVVYFGTFLYTFVTWDALHGYVCTQYYHHGIVVAAARSGETAAEHALWWDPDEEWDGECSSVDVTAEFMSQSTDDPYASPTLENSTVRITSVS